MLTYESGRVIRVLGGLAWGVLFASVPGTSWAQEPQPEPAPDDSVVGSAPVEPSRKINLTGQSPIIDLSTPVPGARVTREYHQHEGLYVRVSGGLGTLLSANIDRDDAEFSSGGASLNLEALVGGGPAPGFTVGGGVLAGLQLSGDWELDNGVGSESSDLTTLIIGPFADGYPDPKGGWHMGGLLGLASVTFQEPGGGDGDSDALGIGGAVWTGYDVWVAPEWSIGGSLRLDALRATNSDDDITVSEVGATLSFSVLYN